ncbi:polysaccharide deacetylase family protein [Amycolatopsis orientalis]|uniref:polysaccharide deacetylase family protein n=1 Tax=Amycolatopsis orientalis TaxID=31958 RepID=UPI0003A3DDEE|nr:polysaccharide deacetylase family protein [Amycolatopsis orientalis]
MSERDFIGYGAEPPAGAWPGGRKVAVSIVLNIEDGAERQTARGDSADDLGAHWERHRVVPGRRNPTLESAFEYGARAGFWRVLRVLREFEAPVTAFCCAHALTPPIAAALVADGHEIANHGLRWDTHTDLSPAEELSRIRSSTALLRELTGKRPACWYSRDGISPGTRAAAAAEGYSYDSNSFCDDLPYVDGSLPVVPYAGDTNDSGLLSQFRTGRAFGAYLCDSLAMLLDDPRPGATVLSVGLHPRLIGRPAYANALRTFLRFAAEQDVWLARRDEIARYWRNSVSNNRPHP